MPPQPQAVCQRDTYLQVIDSEVTRADYEAEFRQKCAETSHRFVSQLNIFRREGTAQGAKAPIHLGEGPHKMPMASVLHADDVSRKPTLQLVVYQEAADVWVARGLQHDLMAEARSIGAAVRALTQLIQSHTAAALRHDQTPLASIRAATQGYWNAFATGTSVSLQQLGIVSPDHWAIRLAVAHRRPSDAGAARPPVVAATRLYS
jgi:hypothetical protein